MLGVTSFLVSALLWTGGVPQIANADQVYFEADDSRGAIDGVVVCRVDVVGDRGFDTFGAIDLAVTLAAGAARVEMWGPEDRSSGVVTAPAQHFALGTKVSILVEDRDVTGRDLVARGAVVVAADHDLSFDLDDAQVKCRTVPAAVAVKRAAPAFARAASAATAVEASGVDLARADLGFATGASLDLETALLEAASWVGGTAEANALKAREATAVQRFRSQVGAAVRAAPAHAVASAGALDVALTDAGLEVAAHDAVAFVTVDIVDEHGGVHAVDAAALRGLGRGANARLPLPPVAGPHLVRVQPLGGPFVVLKR